MYDDRRYSSRSPRKDLDYDDEDGFRIKGRESRAYRDPEVEYHEDYYTRSGTLRYDQEGRPPPAKRPYRGRERYEEVHYEEPPSDPPYQGEGDASLDGRPLRLLLVRNLKESVNEDLFAKGLEKLDRSDESPTGAPEGSLRRVMIVRHRETDKSMTFGFAEYHNVDSASAALAKANDLGDKCTIASKIIQVSFPHLTVLPRSDFGVVETNERFTVVMPSTGARHKYHDERYYPSELVINAQPPHEQSTLSTSGGNGTAGTLENKDKSKKRKAPGATAPAFLQHWQNKAAELRSQEQIVAAEREKEKELKKSQPPASGVNAIRAPTPPAAVVESGQQTFSIDTQKKKCCYLCAAQFKTSEGLQRHLKESATHAAHLDDAATRDTAFERMKKAGVTEDATIRLLVVPPPPKDSSGSTSAAEQAYRDRAAERRKEEGGRGESGSNVSFSLKAGGNSKLKKGSTGNTSSILEPVAPSKPSYGKGMNMLQKAGWSEGQGLGSQEGMGRAAPIDQMMYARGVGLGHEGGKQGDAVEEAERMTKGDREGFLEMTKKVARERYERMG